MYHIEEKEGKGSIVVASIDLKPGVQIMNDSPIFQVSRARSLNISHNKTLITPEDLYNTYQEFLQSTSSENQKKLLSLFDPPDSMLYQIFKDCAEEFKLRYHLTAEELETCLSVSNILSVNAFRIKDGLVTAVYENVTRMSHSCAPNCARFSSGEEKMICVTYQHVKAGEELTISYDSDRDLCPIWERRYKYLRYKLFTCHCVRCDADGDNTRKFPCFHQTCTGSHLVRQPLSSLPLPDPTMQYTSVTYEDPHLLACTICRRIPTSTYQVAMLQLEEKLPPRLNELEHEFNQNIKNIHSVSPEEWQSFVDKMDSLHCPPKHMMAATFWKNRFYAVSCAQKVNIVLQDWLKSARHHQALFEEVFGPTHPKLLIECSEKSFQFELPLPNSVVALTYATLLLRQAIRINLILHGREKRYNNEKNRLDDRLAIVLSKLADLEGGIKDTNTCVTLAQCGFCCEVTSAAELLQLCGRCKKMAYCSVGCQKAHWRVHKASCRAVKKIT